MCRKECIGHVQKRVGTQLRNLKKTAKDFREKEKLTYARKGASKDYYMDRELLTKRHTRSEKCAASIGESILKDPPRSVSSTAILLKEK